MASVIRHPACIAAVLHDGGAAVDRPTMVDIARQALTMPLEGDPYYLLQPGPGVTTPTRWAPAVLMAVAVACLALFI